MWQEKEGGTSSGLWPIRTVYQQLIVLYSLTRTTANSVENSSFHRVVQSLLFLPTPALEIQCSTAGFVVALLLFGNMQHLRQQLYPTLQTKFMLVESNPRTGRGGAPGQWHILRHKVFILREGEITCSKCSTLGHYTFDLLLHRQHLGLTDKVIITWGKIQDGSEYKGRVTTIWKQCTYSYNAECIILEQHRGAPWSSFKENANKSLWWPFELMNVQKGEEWLLVLIVQQS